MRPRVAHTEVNRCIHFPYGLFLQTPAPDGDCSQKHARSLSQTVLSGYAEQFTIAVGGTSVGGTSVGGTSVGGTSVGGFGVNVEVAIGLVGVSVGIVVKDGKGVAVRLTVGTRVALFSRGMMITG